MWFCNQRLVSKAASAGDLLKSGELRGAYTASRSVNRNSIFQFGMHIDRLVESSVPIFTKLQLESKSLNEDKIVETEALPFTLLKEAKLLRPVIEKQLKYCVNEYKKEESINQENNEWKITILISPLPDSALYFNTYIHICQLPSPPKPPVSTWIVCADRKKYSNIKDSQWVIDRKVLEEQMPKEVSEIFLMDEGGKILEGMSSNFGVVIGNGSTIPFRIQTAEENILKGTVRKLLLDICNELNIEVELIAPDIANANDWVGAFACSTSRLLCIIDTLYAPESPITNSLEYPWIQMNKAEPRLILQQNPKRFLANDFLLKLQQLVIEKVQFNSEKVL